jgi:cysteine-rich repeat protein
MGSGTGGAGVGGMSSTGSTGNGGAGGAGGGGMANGDSCSSVIALSGAGSYDFDSTGLAEDYTDYQGSCSDKTAEGADMVFSLELAPDEIADITMTPSASNDAVLVFASSCGDPINSCVDKEDTGGSGKAESLTYANTSGAPQTIYVIADNYYSGDTGPFTLDVAIHTPTCGDGIVEASEVCDDGNATDDDGCTGCVVDAGYDCKGEPSVCVVPPDGDVCGTALVINASGTIPGTFDGFAADYNPTYNGCTDSSEYGADVAYVVSLTAGQVLNATLTPDDGQDLGVYILTDCSDALGSCVAGADDESGGVAETVTYSAAADQQVFLIVDGFDDTLAGPFTLDVDIHTPTCGDGIVDGLETCDDGNPTDGDGCTACAADAGYLCDGAPSVCTLAQQGEICSNPFTISGSGTLTGTLDGFANQYNPTSDGCTGYGEPGEDVAYAVSLTAGQSLSATLTPNDGQDLALYLVTSCENAANACLAGADDGYGGDPETLMHTAAADEQLYLIVDSYHSVSGAYTLDFTIN